MYHGIITVYVDSKSKLRDKIIYTCSTLQSTYIQYVPVYEAASVIRQEVTMITIIGLFMLPGIKRRTEIK